MSDRKQLIRKFYENCLEQEGCAIDGFHYFMQNNRIGRVELLVTGDWGEYGCEGIFDSVEIEPISDRCPQQVREAFDRHIWFSQHNLTNIFVFNSVIFWDIWSSFCSNLSNFCSILSNLWSSLAKYSFKSCSIVTDMGLITAR